MIVYLVVQQGVYRHDIRGVYTSPDAAVAAAKRAAADDSDSYHDYTVYEATLDEYVEDVLTTPGVRAFTKSTLPDGVEP